MSRTQELMLVLQSGDAYPSEHQPEIRSHLKRVRIEGTVLNLASFQDLLSIAGLSRRMKSFFKQREEMCPELTEIAQMLIPMKDLEDHIQSKISERGDLRNDASPELQQLRKSLSTKRNQLRTAIQKALKRGSKRWNEWRRRRYYKERSNGHPFWKRAVNTENYGFVHDVS